MGKKKLWNRLFSGFLALALTVTSVNVLPGITGTNEQVMAVATSASSAYTAKVTVHDPSIFKDPKTGTYYTLGSHLASAISTDLIKWTQTTGSISNIAVDPIYGNIKTLLADLFQWAGQNDMDSRNTYSVWAPDAVYNPYYEWEDGTKGAYMVYICTTSTEIRSCIGYLVSKTMTGNYQYGGSVVYSGFTKEESYDSKNYNGTKVTSKINTKWDGDSLNLKSLVDDGTISGINENWFKSNGAYNNSYAPNAIDPNVFFDAKGEKLYMSYGSWSGGIYLLELDPITGEAIYPGTDKTDSVSGNYIDRYFGVHIAGGRTASGEAPYIQYDEETGYYYLYITYGGLAADGGYNMRLFRSKNPTGPYVDAAGRRADKYNYAGYSAGNNDYGIKVIGNYQFTGEVGYKSAGHNSMMIDDDGQRYLFYHQRYLEFGEVHNLNVRQQFLNEDNWPVTAVYKYTGEQIETYEDAEVIGAYEIINHGKSTDKYMLSSQRIELLSNGKVTGAMTGTWKKTTGKGKDYNYLTIQTSNATYKGVFFKQKDESQKNVMTFSLIGNNNYAIWGKKSTMPASASTYFACGYDFETVSGKAVTAMKGSANPEKAQMVGSAKIETDPIRGKVLHVTNSSGQYENSYLSLPQDALASVDVDDGFTVGMWIKMSALNKTDSSLFEANTGVKGATPYVKLAVNMRSVVDAGGSNFKGNSKTVSKDTWHHVVYTVNRNAAKVYMDGELLICNGGYMQKAFSTTGIPAVTNVTLGAGIGSGIEDVRDVMYDDVVLYQIAMQDYEIASLYNTQKKAQTISGPSSFQKKAGDGWFNVNATVTKGDGTLSYVSSNTKVAKVDANTGRVDLVGPGTAVITVTASATEVCKATTKKITVKVAKMSQTISAKTSFAKNYGDKSFAIGAKAKSTVTYASSNARVAAVSKTTGKVTIKGCGTATITVTAAENGTYSKATKKITITVKPKKLSKPSASSKAKKSIRVTWKKDSTVTGYQVQYSLKKSFSGAKTVKVTKAKTVTTTIKGLKSKKTYYVRVRSYKTEGKKTLTGAWSSYSSVKCK